MRTLWTHSSRYSAGLRPGINTRRIKVMRLLFTIYYSLVYLDINLVTVTSRYFLRIIAVVATVTSNCTTTTTVL